MVLGYSRDAGGLSVEKKTPSVSPTVGKGCFTPVVYQIYFWLFEVCCSGKGVGFPVLWVVCKYAAQHFNGASIGCREERPPLM